MLVELVGAAITLVLLLDWLLRRKPWLLRRRWQQQRIAISGFPNAGKSKTVYCVLYPSAACTVGW